MTDPVSYILPALIRKEDKEITPQALSEGLSDFFFSENLVQIFLVHHARSHPWRPSHRNTDQS